jgi:hypothetical protein
MRKTLVVCTLIVALGSGATYLIGARETWGPDVATDPNYTSGRPSVCEARTLPGKANAANETASFGGHLRVSHERHTECDSFRNRQDSCAQP